MEKPTNNNDEDPKKMTRRGFLRKAASVAAGAAALNVLGASSAEAQSTSFTQEELGTPLIKYPFKSGYEAMDWLEANGVNNISLVRLQEGRIVSFEGMSGNLDIISEGLGGITNIGTVILSRDGGIKELEAVTGSSLDGDLSRLAPGLREEFEHFANRSDRLKLSNILMEEYGSKELAKEPAPREGITRIVFRDNEAEAYGPTVLLGVSVKLGNSSE